MVLTAKGGYLSKQLWAAFQTIRKPTEKDCHSKRYQTITITKDNVDVLTFRYALIKGKLTETSIENLTPLIGTDVQFRSASFCISENICQTCMGTFLEKLDIEDPGLVINRVGSKVMMGMMKKFHDKSVKAKPYDLMSFINEVK